MGGGRRRNRPGWLLATWNLRLSRRGRLGRCRRLRGTAKLIEHALACAIRATRLLLAGRCGRTVENVDRALAVAGQNRERQRRGKESYRENTGGARQGIGRAP